MGLENSVVLGFHARSILQCHSWPRWMGLMGGWTMKPQLGVGNASLSPLLSTIFLVLWSCINGSMMFYVVMLNSV